MPTFPLLPGINTPSDRTEAKQLKLEAAAAAKKTLLETKTGAGERQGISDEVYALAAYQQAVANDNAQEAKAIVSNDDAFTLLGSVIQKFTGASVGTARIAGDTASAPATAFADSQLSGVSDEHRALYQQEQDYNAQVKGLDEAETSLMADVTMGKVGPIEAAVRRLELKNQRKALVAPDTSALDQRPEGRNIVQNPTAVMAFAPSDYEDAGLIETPKTSRELIEGAKNALKFAGSVDKAIEGVTEGLYNPIKRNSLDADMTASVQANKASFKAADAAWEKGDTGTALLEAGKGVAGLVKDFGTDALNNPDAALDYIAENIPQLALGAAGKSGQVLMAGTNLAYGMDIYRKGLEDYQAKNGGKLPTQAEATEMLGWSLSAAAAEQVGDVLTLAPLKGQLGKVMGAAVDKAKAGKLVGAAAELARVPAAVTTGVITEAPTEGYQTAVEENLSKLNSDFDFEQIAKAAGIGGIVGGGLKGGVETMAQTGDIVAKAKDVRVNMSLNTEDKVYADAVKTGDVSQLTDVGSKNFNPTKGILALQEASKAGTLKDEEAQQKANEIHSKLAEQVESLDSLIEFNSEETRPQVEQAINTLTAQLETLEDPEQRAAVEQKRDQFSRLLKTPEELQALTTRRDSLAEAYSQADLTLKSWGVDEQTSEEQVAEVELANSEEATPEARQAVDNTLSLAMRGSKKLSTEQIQSLVSNDKNTLTADERDYLGNVLAARESVEMLERKNQKGVHEEVLRGGNGNKGLLTYQDEFASAVQSADKSSANASLTGLLAFAKAHSSKAQVFSEALNEFLDTGKPVQLLPKKGEGWVRVDQPMDYPTLLSQGGFQVDSRSKGQVAGIKQEAQALVRGLNAMKKAYALSFIKPAQAKTASAPTAAVGTPEVGTEQAGPATIETFLDTNAKQAPIKSDYVGLEYGKIKLLADDDKTSDGTASAGNYRKLNLVRHMMTQKGDREDTLSPRPLVAVEDFISRVADGSVDFQSFTAQPLTEDQVPALSKFMEVYPEWASALKSVLRRPVTRQGVVRNQNFFRDPIQFLMDDNLNMDENVQTAMLAAAYSWLIENLGAPAFRTDEEINAMVGEDKEATVTPELRHLLRDKVGRRSVVQFRIGQAVTQALGLKPKDSTVGQNELARLQANLGAHLIDMMNHMDLIDVAVIERTDIEKARGLEVTGSKVKDLFIQLPRNSDMSLTKALDSLRSVTKGTSGVMGNIFGMETAAQLPYTKPQKSTQKDTNNGRQEVPKSVTAAFNKIGSRPLGFREAMGIFAGASREFQERVAGIKPVDATKVHASRRDSEQAAMDNLRRELDQISEMWDTYGEELEFYAKPELWKNGRMGYLLALANMQTSKIARFLVAPKGWETEVNADNMDSFKLRVLEGLDQKTDSTPDAQTLTTFDDVISAPEYKAAVAAFRTLLQGGEMTAEMENTIGNAVDKAKTKLHAFEALMALAQMEEANGEPFTTMLTTEIDGKTNGPMLSLWLLGVMTSEMAQMGGFYTTDSKVQSFGHWKPGNNDLYQYTASHMAKYLNDAGHSQETLRALYNVLGDLVDKGTVTSAGRNLVKNPLTTLIYGSGMGTTIGKMSASFIEQVYNKVEDIAAGKKYGPEGLVNEAAWNQFQEDLRTLTGADRNLFAGTYQDAMENALSKRAEGALVQAYKDTIGNAVSSVISNELGDYISARKQVVAQAGLVWQIYNDVRMTLREQAIQHLIQNEQLPFRQKEDGTREAIADLSEEQEAAINARIASMEPRIHTALSQQDNNLNAGIYMAKDGHAENENSPYTTEVPGVVQGEKTHHTAQAIVKHETNPGVSVLANSVQSTDGSIIIPVVAQLNSIGVHDAILVSLQDAAKAGQLMNEQTANILLNYSLPRQSYESVVRTITGLAQFMAANPTQDALLANLPTYLQAFRQTLKIEAPVSFQTLVKMAADFAYRADFQRLDGLSQLGVIDQYTIEAGVFEVPKTFREEAAKRRDALKAEVDPQVILAAARLDAMLAGKEIKPIELASEVADMAEDTSAAPVVQGEPVVVPLASLDAFLRDTPDLTASQLITHLKGLLGDSTDIMERQYKGILLLGERLLKDLPVKYITAETVHEIPPKMKDALGWYHVDAKGVAHIGIRGSDLAGSAVTPELVVHEVLHALVAGIIKGAEKGEGSKEVRDAVSDLKQLQLSVKSQLNTKPELLEQFDEALSDIQEFVTWGMTNADFQKVLRDMAYVGDLKEQKQGVLANMAQKFIHTLSRIVFGKSGPARANHLSLLFARVGVLMAEAKQQQTKMEPMTFASRARKQPHQYDPVKLFSGLGKGYTDPALEAHVQAMLSNVLDAVGGPFQHFYQAAVAGSTPAAILNSAQAAGQMPVTAGLRTSGFVMNDQVAFAVEMLTQTMSVSLRDMTRQAEKELQQLFTETSKQVTEADLGGKTQWDAIFGAANIDRDGEYLARFAGMAMAYPPLASKMGFVTQGVQQANTTLYGRIMALFSKAMAFLAKSAHKAYAGQQANEKLDVLVQRLAALEAKYQLRKERAAQPSLTDKFEDVSDSLSEKALKKLEQFGDSGLFQNRKSAGLRLVGETISAVAGRRVPVILEALEKLYHRNQKGQMGFLGSMANEFMGTRQTNLWGRVMLNVTKMREKIRKDIQTDVSQLVKNAFGEKVSREDSAAATQALLRTGAFTLLDQKMSLTQVQQLLASPAMLEKAIDQWEQKLAGHQFEHYFRNQAHHSGYMMATGNTHGAHTLHNAELIVRLHGTKFRGAMGEAEVAQALPIVDTLMTLRAMQYTPAEAKDRAARLMGREAARTDGNGIEALLDIHRHLLAQAKARVFQNSELLVHKGYVPEIHNPYIEVVAAHGKEVGKYSAEGYKMVGQLTRDPSDVLWKPGLLMVTERATPRYLSGNLSLTDMNAKGTTQHSGTWRFDNSGENEFNIQATRLTMGRRGNAINALFRPQPNLDPSEGPVMMSPLFNGFGEVVNHRYTMTHKMRDQVLERTNDMDHVLGVLAANTYDKETTGEHNEKIIRGLFQQWQAEKATSADAYILFGPASADKSVQEQWRLLPNETRNMVEAVWGSQGMMIRRDTFDLHFGYRKWSLTQAMAKDSKDRNGWEKFIAWLGLEVFGLTPKGMRKVLAAEDMVEALSKEIKDFLVVKSGVTLLGNIMSNLTLLWAYGVPVGDILRHHRTALKGALDWHKDSSELRRLQTMRDSGYVVGTLDELNQRIAMLEGQMARNPVRETMLAGMMPTIVEDVDAEDDPYSYKSRLQKRVDKYTDRVPNAVKTVAKAAYMTHDTKVYQILSQGTQLSDYVARFTLYEHLKNRKKNPMTQADAAQRAIDAFINYDIPSHKLLQYFNDKGVVRFTKYYMRIQAVLLHLYQENPARMLMLGLTDNYFNGLQSVLDSSMLNQFGNPLELGPLDYPEAIAAGIPAKLLSQLF